jgi:RNA polymerase sigma-70 factor (ECF subfamily)
MTAATPKESVAVSPVTTSADEGAGSCAASEHPPAATNIAERTKPTGELVPLRSPPTTALVPVAPPVSTSLAPVSEREVTPELVFREYVPRIYALARRMLGNDADAEDVTQDVLVQVVRKLHTFRGESQLGTWLHRVTVNAALAHRSRRANRQKHETSDIDETALDSAVLNAPVKRWHSAPEEPVLTAEQAEVIEKAIAQLPEPYRDVYVLADIEQLSNADIAERLGLSVAAVKSRLHRARLRMREALARYFEQANPASLSASADLPDGEQRS